MATRNVFIDIETLVKGKLAGVTLVQKYQDWAPPDEEAGESWDGWPPQPTPKRFLHALVVEEAGAPTDMKTVANFMEYGDDLPADMKDKSGEPLHVFWGTPLSKNEAERTAKLDVVEAPRL